MRTKQPVAPVVTRNVLDGLAPVLRARALREAGGDPTRVTVLSRGRYEVRLTD